MNRIIYIEIRAYFSVNPILTLWGYVPWRGEKPCVPQASLKPCAALRSQRVHASGYLPFRFSREIPSICCPWNRGFRCVKVMATSTSHCSIWLISGRKNNDSSFVLLRKAGIEAFLFHSDRTRAATIYRQDSRCTAAGCKEVSSHLST